MLQIISGRFFGGGHVEEKEEDAVLYSNLAWLAPVDAGVAQLRPTDGRGHAVTAYVVRYANRYEPLPGDPRVLAPAEEAVDQLRLLASFWFEAFFHPDRHHVELLCRGGPHNSLDDIIPRSFAPRYFEPGRWATAGEAAGFAGFAGSVLAMPRKRYRLVMACLGNFLDALEAIGTNFDLAYGMMVYVLEALCQSEDGYAPAWEDYDQKVRGKLEDVFARIDPGEAEAIRGALLESAHLKLMKRFVGFVASHVTDDFFMTQAEGLMRALPRSGLEQSLRNLYNSRSGFVHQLKRVREQLRHPMSSGGGDVFDWTNEPHLTYPGLVRLVRHVLSTFISRQRVLEREDYPAWRDELPDTIVMEMAPQYWIWQAEGFTPQAARGRFSGLFAHALDLFASTGKPMANMDALMEVIEGLVNGARRDDRVAMLALYWLYHLLAPADHRPGWEELLSRHEAELERCSVELLAIRLVVRRMPTSWPLAECVAAFEEYQRRRYKPSAVHLPVMVEVAIMASIANMHLEAGDRDSFAAWADRAILDAAGRKPIQDTLADRRAAFLEIDTRSLTGLPPAPATEAVEHPPVDVHVDDRAAVPSPPEAERC